MQMEKIETFLSLMVQNYGEDLLCQGRAQHPGRPRRMIFQGVHMLMEVARQALAAGRYARA
jgi:hypothetical protein